MTLFLLAAILRLCWAPAVDPDPPGMPPGTASGLSHYVVMWGYRVIEGWEPCPTEDDPDAMCVIYDPPAGTIFWSEGICAGELFVTMCPDSVGSVCYFTGPEAVDRAGNHSPPAHIPGDAWCEEGICCG